MRRLFVYIRRFWPRYAFGLTATLAFSILQNLLPILMRDAIDAVQKGYPTRLGHLVELMCVLAVMMGATRCLSRVTMFNTGRDIEYNLRNELFAHLAKLGPDFYERLKTGDLMSRMINDLTAVRMMVGMGVLQFINTPVTYMIALIFMFSLNPKLAHPDHHANGGEVVDHARH